MAALALLVWVSQMTDIYICRDSVVNTKICCVIFTIWKQNIVKWNFQTWKNIQNPEAKLTFLTRVQRVSKATAANPVCLSQWRCFIIGLVKPLHCLYHSLVKINIPGHYAWARQHVNPAGCLSHWWRRLCWEQQENKKRTKPTQHINNSGH